MNNNPPVKIGSLIKIFQIINLSTGDSVEVVKGLVVDHVTDDDVDRGVVTVLDDKRRLQTTDLSQYRNKNAVQTEKYYVYSWEIGLNENW